VIVIAGLVIVAAAVISVADLLERRSHQTEGKSG
jgi:hypothetical protein